jgi:negative regulator of replication initiation
MSELKRIGIDVEVNAAIEAHRRSFSESENDILRRLLLDGLVKEAPRRGSAPGGLEAEPGERSTGRWTVEVQGERVAAANLKGAYRTLLLILAQREPDFLQRYAEESSRSRRFVARVPKDLYLATPELAKDHAKPLTDGWYFDTNLSTDQVARRIRIAARVCGLRYGSDVRLLNNLEQI